MITIKITMEDGSTHEMVASDKIFSSGKTGYWGQAKVHNGGQKYQVQVQAVKIQPKAE